MAALIQYLPLLGLVVLANLAERDKTARFLTRLILIAMNLAFLGVSALFGLLYLITTQGSSLAASESARQLAFLWGLDHFSISLACLVTALFAFSILWLPVRKLLARLVPLDPRSFLDSVALVLIAYYVGLTAVQLVLLGGLQALAKGVLSPAPLDVLVGGVSLTAIAFLGVGWGTRHRLDRVLNRLGLHGMSLKQWRLATGLVLSFLAFDFIVTIIWSKLDPVNYALVSEAMAGLLGSLALPQKALLLALSAGIGEELLFRGALQPRFGIWFTSLAFALGHMQYGFSPAMLEVFVISVVLAFVRQKTNTTTCIVVHAVYNFTDLILMSSL